jgi:putative membrane protein
MGYGMMGRGLMFYPFGGLFMWVLIVIVVGIVVYFIVRTQRSVGGRGSLYDQEGTPLDIAKKRYARGEISKEEFEDIRNNL